MLRSALAGVNVPAVVAIVRAACGLSQKDMAAVAGWSPAVLSYYERGRRDAVFDIRVIMQFADAVGMPRAALVALVLADPDATGGSGWPAPDRSPGAAHRVVSDSRLLYWRSCTGALHERDRDVGGTSLLRPALLLRQQVGESLQRPRHAGAGSMAGQLAVLAGIVLYAGHAALDAGSLVLAGSLHDTARDLAGEAQDPQLAIQLLLAQSQLRAGIARSGGSRDPARQALHLAREAADEARYEQAPQLHALIAIRHAQAAALLGDKPVFNTAITRARRELDRPRG